MKYNDSMRKARMFFIQGIWIAILPYLGFPYPFRNGLISLSGLLLAYFGFMMYKDFKAREEKKRVFENFSENI